MAVRMCSDKEFYEQALGRKISDSTWYRVLENIKQSTDGMYTKSDLEMYADMRKATSKLPINSVEFIEVWKTLKEFKCSQQEMEGKTFKSHILKTMPLNLPLPTFYRWFNRNGMVFRNKKVYKTKELIPILAAAKCWYLRKVNQSV